MTVNFEALDKMLAQTLAANRAAQPQRPAYQSRHVAAGRGIGFIPDAERRMTLMRDRGLDASDVCGGVAPQRRVKVRVARAR